MRSNSAGVASAVALYLLTEKELKDKSTSELEETVRTLSPKVDVDNALFGGGVVTILGSLIGGLIAEAVGLKEYSGLGLEYITLPATLFTVAYGLSYSSTARGLGIRYKRDAADNILKERAKNKPHNSVEFSN